MPGNTIRINKSVDLDWYVGDSKMEELIEWLNENGIKRDDLRDCDCCSNEECDICNKKREMSKVIDFEDAVKVKSKHQLLDTWIVELIFPGEVGNFIQETSGSSDGAGEVRRKFRLYTNDHIYAIVAIDREDEKGYLGCTAATRKARAGEPWNRGNDLPDGPFNKKTWDKIISGILRYELIKLSDYKKPDSIPEDIA